MACDGLSSSCLVTHYVAKRTGKPITTNKAGLSPFALWRVLTYAQRHAWQWRDVAATGSKQ